MALKNYLDSNYLKYAKGRTGWFFRLSFSWKPLGAVVKTIEYVNLIHK